MPKLLAFLPCEKVVIEQGTNNVSVDSLIETLSVTVPQGTLTVPEGTVVPMTWATFALFEKETGDSGEFESRSELYAHSGVRLFQTAIGKWQFKNDAMRHSVIAKINGMPIWVPGICKLKLMLKAPGDTDFKVVQEVAIRIKHEATRQQSGEATH